MALNERSEGAIRRSVSRLVAVRWPGERVLLATACETERVASRTEALLGVLGRAHCPGGSCVVDSSHLHEPALLCATDRRLIYQGRRPHGLPLRVTSIAVAALAFLALVGQGPGAGFAALGLTAVALWLAADLAQAIGIRSGALEFRRITQIDRAEQRLDGIGRWGTLYRLRIPDPDDFLFVAAMVGRDAG